MWDKRDPTEVYTMKWNGNTKIKWQAGEINIWTSHQYG